MTNLMRASNQLFNRKDDEIFETRESFYDFLKQQAEVSYDTVENMSNACLDFDEQNNPYLSFNGKKGYLTEWSMRQMCTELGIPFEFFNRCPKRLAKDNVDYFFGDRARNADALYMMNKDGKEVIRAITSKQYERIFDWEVAGHLFELNDQWKIPLTWAKERRGLYAGDRDMFAFMIDGGSWVEDKSDGGLNRGFFIRNSEVKNGSFEIVTFFHRGVCGNHIVWNANNIQTVRIIHKGKDARSKAFMALNTFLEDFANADMRKEEELIKVAQKTRLGIDEEEVIDIARGLIPNNGLSKKLAKASYAEAAMNFTTDGDPRTVWGFVNGMTRVSQQGGSIYADERTRIDSMAGRILDMTVGDNKKKGLQLIEV